MQTRVGLLMLLSAWLTDSTVTVAHFLASTANIPFVSLNNYIKAIFFNKNTQFLSRLHIRKMRHKYLFSDRDKSRKPEICIQI